MRTQPPFRTIGAALLATVLLMITSPAFAANDSGVASATGSGHFMRNGALRTFAFQAERSADGTVRGMANLHSRSAGVYEHIAIDCLRVVGNVAYMSGMVVNSNPSDITGAQARFAVVDNAEGSGEPDQVSLVETYGPGSATDCMNADDFPGGLFNVERGNVQVRSR